MAAMGLCSGSWAIWGQSMSRQMVGSGGWSGAWLVGQLGQQMALAEQDGELGVGYHEGKALCRVAGVKGQVGAPGFEDAQDGDDHGQGALGGDTDDAFWPDPLLLQVVGQLVGPAVELTVAELGLAEADGAGLGMLGCLGFDEVVDALVVGVGDGCLVPFDQQLLLFSGGEYWQLADGLLGLGHDAGQQALVVAGQPLDGLRLEQV